MEKLVHIENCKSLHVGEAEIYRFRDPPYDYLIRQLRIFN